MKRGKEKNLLRILRIIYDFRFLLQLFFHFSLNSSSSSSTSSFIIDDFFLLKAKNIHVKNILVWQEEKKDTRHGKSEYSQPHTEIFLNHCTQTIK